MMCATRPGEAANRLSEAATAMNEMNSTVLEVASNAEGAADAASSVQGQANEGNNLVLKTIESLRTLRTLSLSLKSDMGNLDKQANDIGTVLTPYSRYSGSDQFAGPQRGHRGRPAPARPAADLRLWPMKSANWRKRP